MFDLRTILNTFAILCCLFAWLKGGRAERASAIAVGVNILVGQLGAYIAPSFDGQLRLVNDGLTALVLLGVTVRYGALWMGGVMLFFAVQFAMHSFYIVTLKQADYLGALINNIDYLGIVSCLIIGTIVAWVSRIKARRANLARAAALSPAPPQAG
jgi:hypothetical protein